jgi:hypothetical protein
MFLLLLGITLWVTYVIFQVYQQIRRFYKLEQNMTLDRLQDVLTLPKLYQIRCTR